MPTRPTPTVPISAAVLGETASLTPSQVAPAFASHQGGPPFNRFDMSSGVRPSQAVVDKIMGMGLGFTREQIMQALPAIFDSSARPDQMLFDV